MFVKLVLVKHVTDLSGNVTHHMGSLLNGLMCGFCHNNDFPGGSDGKASAYNVGDWGSIPGSGRSPGQGNGNPFQYSCLENPMGGTW